MPAHGRRLRRQGNADVAVRVHRRPFRAALKDRGQASPRPRRRHALDRQAARVPVCVGRGLRRRRAHPGTRFDTRVALRLLGRLVRPGERPRRFPFGQHVLASQRRDPFIPVQDPHRLGDRLPRLRRPARHVRDRDGDGRGRPYARPRSARRAPREFLRQGHEQRRALRHGGRGQHRAGDGSAARNDLPVQGTPARYRGVEPRQPFRSPPRTTTRRAHCCIFTTTARCY